MTYEQVLKLITPEFVKRIYELCEFDFEEIDIIRNYEIILKCANGKVYKRSDIHCVNLRLFQADLFQAWIWWNRKNNPYKQITIETFRRCLTTFLADVYYSDFESGKPLIPEVQALICALSKAMELEKAK